MKLKTLSIHNLASIEDATLDFSKEPLQGSEVFLITGKTGSGKSTILDAVCLAVYGNTPRLENTSMDGKTLDLEQQLTVKDARQMMRRNTGEAWARLVFEGNNGIDYEAEWYVARAWRRADGTLQSAKRSLKRLDDGVVLDKVRDIALEVDRAVGLDFAQFCRTTMLAQGQFTRFLNSDDKEKAAILEKITGVDVYTKLGKKIHVVAGLKESDYNQALSSLCGFVSLSEEEVDARRKRKEELGVMLEDASGLRGRIEAKQAWLSKNEELTRLSVSQAEAFESSKARWEGEEVRDGKALLSDWKESIDPRSWLSESANNALEAGTVRKSLSDKSFDFHAFEALLRKEMAHLDKDRERLAAVEERIGSLRAKASVVENAQTLASSLRQVIDGRKSIADLEKAMAALGDRIDGELSDALSAAKLEEGSRTAALAACGEEKAAADKALAAIPLAQLRKRKEELDSSLAKIELAFVRLEGLGQAKLRFGREEAALKEKRAECEALKEKLAALERPLAQARLLEEERGRVLRLQLTTVDKWAKQARKSLGLGDLCPVCGQRLAGELPREDALDDLLSLAQKEYDEAKRGLDALAEEFDGLERGLRVCQDLVESKARGLETDTSVETAGKAALAVLASLGLSGLETAERDLESSRSGSLEVKARTEKAIAEGEVCESNVRRLEKKLLEAKDALDKAKEASSSAQKRLEMAKVEWESFKKRIEDKAGSVAEAEARTATILKDSGEWEVNWAVDPAAFIPVLEEVVSHHKQLLQHRDALNSSVVERGSQTGWMRKTLDEISRKQPLWRDQPLDDPARGLIGLRLERIESERKNLEDTLSGLDREVVALSGKLSDLEARNRQLDVRVEAFLSDHSSFSLERLGSLNEVGLAEVKRLEALVGDASSALERSRAALDATRQQLDSHSRAKPALGESDTLELLSEERGRLDSQLSELNRLIGGIDKELEENEAKKEERKRLADLVERKRVEFERWSRLKSLIGCSTGEKFRRIAQSYVLSALVDAANVYMATLAPRYSLQVQPGSFVISIEDAYQGYARRAASTISGGESFLVSLSLALALSDIGTRLSVDTLFIDEGFGTLSGEPLRNAIETLRSLHSRLGRHVGIISHVEELQERIPVQVRVEQTGGSSSSKVTVVS